MTGRASRLLAVAVASVAAAFALAAVGCGGSSSSTTSGGGAGGGGGSGSGSGATRELTVLLDWFPNPDHAALYVAQEKGYFERAGLDVKLQAPSNASDPAKLVSTGKVPLGISYEPEVIISQAHGLEVKAVAALIPVALNSLISPGKNGIRSVADLKGKKVGSAGLASDTAYMKAIMGRAGMSLSDVELVNVGSNLVSTMLSGSVDATIGGYRNVEAIQLEDRGADPWVLPITDAGVPTYDELVIIANSDRLASDASYRKQVRAFLRALAKGNAAALADPAAAEDALAPVAKGYSEPLLEKMIDATVPLLKNAKRFGYMDPADWGSFATWMYRHKLIAKQVDGRAAMTDEYLPGS